MVDIYPRSTWSPRYENGDRTLTGLAEAVSIHHSVTTLLPGDATVAMECAVMRALELIGERRFGFGISYNVVIFPSGRAYQGVDFNRRGTHTDGMNSTVRSICFAGNFELVEPSQAALDTARAIIAEKRGVFWKTDADVFGHKDIKPTACPGKYLYAHIPYLESGAVPVNNPIPLPVPVPVVKPKREPRPLPEVSRYSSVPGWEGLWQRFLKSEGYNIVVDNDFGDITHRLTCSWQSSKGLVPDGKVGPRSWARALLCDPSGVLQRGDHNEEVEILQHIVGAFVDSRFGDQTGAHTGEVQRFIGTDDDEKWGPNSSARLLAYWLR